MDPSRYQMPRFRSCNEERSPPLGQRLADWQSSLPGERLVAHERDVLESMVADLFGYQLLQIGELGGDLGHLARCSIQRKTLLSDRPRSAQPGMIVAEAERLPIASDCVDTVILPHSLDFARDAHQMLREVERVLIADGRVIVVGFNPFSLWGLWRLFGRWGGAVPWCGNFFSYPRLSDWLSLMGFDVERMDVLEFRPPSRSGGFEWIDRIGRQFWPMLAGVYVVRAVKRVSRITPVRQRWPRLRVIGPRAIGPTARQLALKAAAKRLEK